MDLIWCNHHLQRQILMIFLQNSHFSRPAETDPYVMWRFPLAKLPHYHQGCFETIVRIITKQSSLSSGLFQRKRKRELDSSQFHLKSMYVMWRLFSNCYVKTSQEKQYKYNANTKTNSNTNTKEREFWISSEVHMLCEDFFPGETVPWRICPCESWIISTKPTCDHLI